MISIPPRLPSVAILLVLGTLGCAHRVKNLAPTRPFDFAALTEFAKYSQAAYGEEPAIRAVLPSAFDELAVRPIPTTNNRYYLATNRATKTQVVAIAGTSNIENVLLDADLTRQYDPELGIVLHRGFSRAARAIYEDLRPRLLDGGHLQLTGHSLGGAEALILGMLLKNTTTPAEVIVTFGAPKVTDEAGVKAFETLPLTRVVNGDDVVPALPLKPYRSIGPELVLFPGTDYSLVEVRPLDPASLVAAWNRFQNHEAPREIEQHYMASYLTSLEPKLQFSRLIPYPARSR